jgi:integrase
MDTGMRPGSLFKMQWKHVTENTAIPKEERLTWVNLDIPAENSKTGRSYRIAAPVAKFLEKLRKVSRFTKKNDFMFANQASGKQLSARIWHGAISDLLVEARLADWTDDSNSQTKKISVHSGKQLSWYSFRHTYITMRLSAGVPLPTIAGNTDTSMKYIQEHYFHYRAEQQTEILSKGRKVTTANEQLKWIDSLTSN